MGQYTVYCNGSENLNNLSGGVGELRIDNPSISKSDFGKLYFDKAPVPAGEVFDSASALAVYCHAPSPLSLILGQISGPSWNGPEWKNTTGGVVHNKAADRLESIENAVIGLVEDGASWMKLRLRRGERPSHEGSYSAQVDYIHYYGRNKPEPYFSGMEDASHDLSFSFLEYGQIDVLRSLLGATVVYKDCWGDLVIGTLGSVQASHGRAQDVQFTIVETDHRQEISYE